MPQYSVVSYLDPTSRAQIHNIQEKLFTVTGSRACLDHWLPHITVGNGLVLENDNLELIEHELSLLSASQQLFQVRLQSFGGTDNWVPGKGDNASQYVLWVTVTVTNELQSLVDSIREITQSQEIWYAMPVPYTPHVTVAFRDLDKEGYDNGLAFLKDTGIDIQCSVTHVALVEKLDDEDKQYKRFTFEA